MLNENCILHNHVVNCNLISNQCAHLNLSVRLEIACHYNKKHELTFCQHVYVTKTGRKKSHVQNSYFWKWLFRSKNCTTVAVFGIKMAS